MTTFDQLGVIHYDWRKDMLEVVSKLQAHSYHLWIKAKGSGLLVFMRKKSAAFPLSTPGPPLHKFRDTYVCTSDPLLYGMRVLMTPYDVRHNGENWPLHKMSITPNIIMICIGIQGEEHHYREEQGIV
jgi:hypothetical protein